MPRHTAKARRRVDTGKKYFSLEEANRALPYVSRIVDDVTGCYRLAVDIRERIENPKRGDEPEQLKLEYEHAMDRLNELIDELHHVGVELKDFEKGVLDFPAIHEGREIYLSWQRADAFVRTWHEAGAGFSGRKDVALLAPPASAQVA